MLDALIEAVEQKAQEGVGVVVDDLVAVVVGHADEVGAAHRELVARYKERAAHEKTVFGGRLGDYAYYDMDITICAALKCFDRGIA